MSLFHFTFNFFVPGLLNPFSSSPAINTTSSTGTGLQHAPVPAPQHVPAFDQGPRKKRNFDTSFPDHDLKRPLALPPPPLPKRSWAPSSSVPSNAAMIPASPRGFLQSFPRHGDGFDMDQRNEREEEVELDAPPSKRRKGITGAVISSAFNAALVGAAVGLTIFRKWKDVGKEVEQSPPPPYQEEWAPSNAQESQPKLGSANLVLSSGHRPQSVSHKRANLPIRRTNKTVRRAGPSRRNSSPKKPQVACLVPAESESSMHVEEDQDVEMDWIGDRLAKLIEDGKRALGTEIVVSSEAPEDEVDDGTGDWVEDEEASASFAFDSRRNLHLSPKPKKRSRFSSAFSAPPSKSARISSYSRSRDLSEDPSTMNTTSQSNSMLFSPSISAGAFDGGLSESPSVREAMERARAAYRQRRGTNVIY